MKQANLACHERLLACIGDEQLQPSKAGMHGRCICWFFWRRKSQYLLACEHLNKQISLQRAQRSKTEQSGNAWQVHLGLFLKEESIPRLGCVHASGKLRVQNCTSQVFSLARNLDLSIHVYGFLEPSQNETGQQLLFSWGLRREHPSFQVWSTVHSETSPTIGFQESLDTKSVTVFMHVQPFSLWTWINK